MLEKLKGLGYTKPVADAGFESEENYTWCEEHGQTAFVKPANYDTRKTRKYKNDIGRRENMPYDAHNDSYLCYMGHPIRAALYPNPFSGSAKRCWRAFKARKVFCCA